MCLPLILSSKNRTAFPELARKRTHFSQLRDSRSKAPLYTVPIVRQCTHSKARGPDSSPGHTHHLSQQIAFTGLTDTSQLSGVHVCEMLFRPWLPAPDSVQPLPSPAPEGSLQGRPGKVFHSLSQRSLWEGLLTWRPLLSAPHAPFSPRLPGPPLFTIRISRSPQLLRPSLFGYPTPRHLCSLPTFLARRGQAKEGRKGGKGGSGLFRMLI